MKRLLLISFLSTALIGALIAAPPQWWSNGVIDPQATPSPNSPTSIGQLKNISKRAAEHLDQNLYGGAGSQIWDMINAWEVSTPNNFSPCNLAQVKATARPFYDRLIAAGYDTKQNLLAHGYPSNWAYDYPWEPNTPVSANMAPCNLAQLKMVFSFDLADFDADLDGLPDEWENNHGFDSGNSDWNHNGVADGEDDFDGDGVSNVQEIADGTDPLDAGDYHPGSQPNFIPDSSNQTQMSVWTFLY